MTSMRAVCLVLLLGSAAGCVTSVHDVCTLSGAPEPTIVVADGTCVEVPTAEAERGLCGYDAPRAAAARTDGAHGPYTMYVQTFSMSTEWHVLDATGTTCTCGPRGEVGDPPGANRMATTVPADGTPVAIAAVGVFRVLVCGEGAMPSLDAGVP